jgi:light-harvesting complex I chlorophyll a/b binding protein 4
VHARWAMLGVAGVLGQEILRPDVFWYEAGLPQNLPGPFQNINMGGLLAWEFLLMHWVEVRRWQDYKNFGSVNEVRSASFGGHACADRALICC